MPKKDYRILDVWNASGLKGTGSNDVEIGDVFVPDAMTLAVADVSGGPSPGGRVVRATVRDHQCSRCFPMCSAASRSAMREACLDGAPSRSRGL